MRPSQEFAFESMPNGSKPCRWGERDSQKDSRLFSELDCRKVMNNLCYPRNYFFVICQTYHGVILLKVEIRGTCSLHRPSTPLS
ncbi:hypothetical protein GOP47_0018941 [Adiantum capillus-veneris]|uniref:Uncharacterized protein n=1 Tax=Adiantum capillus-veneris TaxID=13818 RepID=A0A9D4UEN6_ADICA|nr:hypothetical protein GOP47_0018941 [Adiantum capillus-veneris]